MTSGGSFSTRSDGFLSFVGRLNFVTGFLTLPALTKGPDPLFGGLLI